jgi:diguanylate cyclase (GGDEF)-like protein/PAS domain S-box-containing protein
VDTAEALEDAIASQTWDIIFADYTMPHFSGTRALAMTRKRGLDIPFIFVSGTIGEDTAVEAMRSGAQDYIMKGNTKRLLPAVERELRETELRREYARSEEHRRATEARFRHILTLAVDAIIAVDAQYQITTFNRGAERIFGYRFEEVLGQSLDLLLPLPEIAALLESLTEAGECREIRGRRKDGGEFPAELTVSRLNEAGDVTYTLILRDISERKRAEREMHLLQTISQTAGESNDIHMALNGVLRELCSVIEWDLAQAWVPRADGAALVCSPAWYSAQKGKADEYRKASMMMEFGPGQGLPGRVWSSQHAEWSTDYAAADEFPRPELARELGYTVRMAIPVMADQQAVAVLELLARGPARVSERLSRLVQAVAAQFGGILQKKHMEQRLHYMAHYDVLIGLPNRVLVRDRLSQAIAEAGRHGRLLGVAMLDLDRFKTVNDSLGHAWGDRLLTEVAARLRRAVREDDTIARLGGDEFTLILCDMAQLDDAARVAQKILACFAEPFRIDEHELYVNISMGMTLYPLDDSDVDGLLRNADIAMYRAKDQGGSTFQFHTPEMTARIRDRVALEYDLRGALSRQEFELYYQPIVELATRRMVGVEALIRWHHPQRGLVSPLDFIPLAEETGLIVDIGAWVLRAGCEQIVAWRREGRPPLRLSVNTSARQFQQADLDAVVARVVQETGCDPAALDLEITESLLIDNATVVMTLRQLHRMGLRLSIDDFGTGYSSLSYLRRFPVDHLKIDRSFVQDITTNDDAKAVAVAIITMAHALGIKVIAEGVETEEQLAFLWANQCDMAQGYHLGHPLPAAELAKRLV